MPSYYAIIIANVRYDRRLKANEKLLYGEISALTQANGYCYASNEYFANLYNVTKNNVTKWIANLVAYGYITAELKYKRGTKQIEYRIIRLSTALPKKSITPNQKRLEGSNQKRVTPIIKKDEENKNRVLTNITSKNKYNKIPVDKSKQGSILGLDQPGAKCPTCNKKMKFSTNNNPSEKQIYQGYYKSWNYCLTCKTKIKRGMGEWIEPVNKEKVNSITKEFKFDHENPKPSKPKPRYLTKEIVAEQMRVHGKI